MKHAFVSPKSDGGDATLARPSDWNAAHVFSYDIESRTAGDIAVTSTTAGNALGTIGDLVVPAVTGDLLILNISTLINDTDGLSVRLDVATIVSAAVVNYVSSSTSTPATLGIPAWFTPASLQTGISGSVPYVVQSGDISSGTVTLSLRAWLSGAGSRPVSATTTGPFVFWVMNLG